MVQARFFTQVIQKSHLKPLKISCFLSYCTCLPKFGCRMTKIQKSMWHYWKMKVLFFCVFYTVWTFSHPKMKSCSFSISSQFNFKNGHFFKPSNGQNGNFNNHKQLIIGQGGIPNLCQTDFWAFSGYQLIVVCFGSPKVLRRQMLDIKCKQKLLDIRN